MRARVIVAFAVGALLLSTLLSVVTYSVTSGNLVDRLERDALANAKNNAQLINAQLTASSDPADLDEAMRSIITPTDTLQAMLFDGSGFYVDSVRFNDEEMNFKFRAAALGANPTEMTFDIFEEQHFVVGLPIPSAEANASYIQAAPMAAVENALGSLRPTLIGASVITTILGMALGVYAARRLFRPIGDIGEAAQLIAGGDLTTRLAEDGDPDLDPLAHSFNDMTSALKERIERDSRFASDVSHELRSPLMTLTGSVAVLERRREDMPERAQLALDLLSADIKRFKVLVEDLLEISRFDVGAVELDREEVVFGEFVRQAIGAAVRRERDVPIIHQPGTEEAFIEIDKRRIAQVIRNLSENADKYAAGVTQVRLAIDGDDIRIELEDEGPGVPEDERELIFERFARGSEGGRRGSGTGVGLGLSLVTEHLRLHGGTVTVTDRVDGLNGARFVVSLPDVVVP